MAGEWKNAAIADVAIRVTKGTTPTTIGGQFVDEGIKFVKVESITNDGRIDTDKLAHIDEATNALLSRSVLQQDDILFTIAGTIGRVALVQPSVLPANTNQAVAIVRPNPEEVLPRFLYYVLRDESRVRQAHTRVVQSVQANFSLGELGSLEIPLPPLPEQRAIAWILGALDDKIELNRRMNQTLEAMGRAIFKSWFVDFDPVRAKAEGRDTGLPDHIADLFPDGFEPSALGRIPRGWRVGTFGEVARNRRQGVSPSDLDPGTPYIALEHMPRRCIALDQWGIADDVASGKFRFQRAEILFGKLRPYFHKVGIAPIDGVCSTDILVVAANSQEWFGFVMGHISSAEFVNHTDATSTGTKMPRTNWSEMSRYDIVIPNEPVASTFSRLIHPVVDRIIGNIYEAHPLATVRDTLLPKLISGELRVPDAERFLATRL